MNEKPERQERTQRQTILGLAAGLLIASWLAVAFWSQRNDALSQHEAALAVQATAQAEAEAQRNTAVREASMRATAQAEAAVQRTLAQALQMVATGQLVFDRIPQGPLIGTLLGVEALQRGGPLLEANQFIRRGLKLLPIEVARMTHDDNVTDVALSPDGRLVVSGSRVWETVTGREVARLTHAPYDAAFSPDGRYVVSGSWDTTARVWEADTRREVARMTHDGEVLAVAFSPDGQYVVSGSENGTARVWWWRPEDLIAEACRRLPRNLTREEWQRYVGPEVPYHATCPGKP